MKFLYLGSACYVLSALFQTGGLCERAGENDYANFSEFSTNRGITRARGDQVKEDEEKIRELSAFLQTPQGWRDLGNFLASPEVQSDWKDKLAKYRAQKIKCTQETMQSSKQFQEWVCQGLKCPTAPTTHRTSTASLPATSSGNKSDDEKPTFPRPLSWPGALPQDTSSVGKKQKFLRSLSWSNLSARVKEFFSGSKQPSKSSSCPASPSTEGADRFALHDIVQEGITASSAKRTLPLPPRPARPAVPQETALYGNSQVIDNYRAKNENPYLVPGVKYEIPAYHAPAAPGQEVPDFYANPANLAYDVIPAAPMIGDDDLPLPPSDEFLAVLNTVQFNPALAHKRVRGTVQFSSVTTPNTIKPPVKVKPPIAKKPESIGQTTAQHTTPARPPRTKRAARNLQQTYQR